MRQKYWVKKKMGGGNITLEIQGGRKTTHGTIGGKKRSVIGDRIKIKDFKNCKSIAINNKNNN